MSTKLSKQPAPATNGERTNVAIPAEVHERHAHIAKLLGRPIQDCTAEAVGQWNDTNAGRAAKRSRELLGKAA